MRQLRQIPRGDWDGFVAAFINNLVQLLILTPLCLGVLGFSAELVIGKILPGIAISFLVGNLYYAHLAKKQMRLTGRDDITALPYGISTPAVFANIFLVMLPAKLMAEAQGLENPEQIAWQAGLLACALGGVIELLGAFVASNFRRWIPRVALISTLGGVGMGFLGMAFLFQIMESPLAGLPVFFLGLALLLRPPKLPVWLPATGIILLFGTALGWLTGAAPVSILKMAPLSQIGLHLPTPQFGALMDSFRYAELATIISVVLPISLLGVIASLQNIESAAAAGDEFPERPCLLVNGLGTLCAAFFGSPFPTSIYIGHPAWKKMGATSTYSTLNGTGIGLLCISGSLAAIVWTIPVEAGITIIFWIGLIITAQAFETSEPRHYPAAIVGIMPGLAAWVFVVIGSILTAGNFLSDGAVSLSPGFLTQQASMGNFLGGGLALQQGFLLIAMLWSAITYYIIERDYNKVATYALIAAVLSAIGIIHGFVIENGAALVDLPILQKMLGMTGKWRMAAASATGGYLVVALLFFIFSKIPALKSGQD
jgi:AGZA family xanthine/uracil permease-like MFS transporter